MIAVYPCNIAAKRQIKSTGANNLELVMFKRDVLHFNDFRLDFSTIDVCLRSVFFFFFVFFVLRVQFL